MANVSDEVTIANVCTRVQTIRFCKTFGKVSVAMVDFNVSFQFCMESHKGCIKISLRCSLINFARSIQILNEDLQLNHNDDKREDR